MDSGNSLPNEDSEDSENSCVEIFNGGHDINIYKETELIKFSKILFEAQKKALKEEKVKKNKWKAYSEQIQQTTYCQKCCCHDLATKGYLSIYKFKKHIKE